MMKWANGVNEATEGLPFSLLAHFGFGSSLLDIGYSYPMQDVTPGFFKRCLRGGLGVRTGRGFGAGDRGVIPRACPGDG